MRWRNRIRGCRPRSPVIGSRFRSRCFAFHFTGCTCIRELSRNLLACWKSSWQLIGRQGERGCASPTYPISSTAAACSTSSAQSNFWPIEILSAIRLTPSSSCLFSSACPLSLAPPGLLLFRLIVLVEVARVKEVGSCEGGRLV